MYGKEEQSGVKLTSYTFEVSFTWVIEKYVRDLNGLHLQFWQSYHLDGLWMCL